MAKADVKKIISEAKKNEKFMTTLLKNPEEALMNYDISKAELEFFKSADRKTLEGLKDSCFELVK
ncbi:hypothetical protein [Candidatus Uabimicrobium sp. HlEnr_7]|uniref:hypothetical protein n=1 Tax=Candidatus Uabimicrobium helgolandensis TaxID=3095367 RepID=UPI003556E9B0